jgi:hypothetical protein
MSTDPVQRASQTLADQVTSLREGRLEFFRPWAKLERSDDPFLRNCPLEGKLIPPLDVTA